MAGDSKVGTSGVYEAGDQRNHKNEELDTAERFEEGKENSHQATDSSMFLLRSKFLTLLTPSQRTRDPLPTDLRQRRYVECMHITRRPLTMF